MNVIGIGQAGCAIAEKISEYEQYNVFYVDSANAKKRKNFLKVKAQPSHEKYESEYKKLRLSKLPSEQTVLILCGAGKISGIILRFLEQIKDRDLKILYVKPDLDLLDNDSRTRERIVFGVLQEYARSNLIKDITIVSNPAIEAVLDDVSIVDYWDNINSFVASTFHMLNVFNNTEPLLNTMTEVKEVNKISTFGVASFKDLDEKVLYPLESPRLKKYFFGISEKTLNEEKDLLHRIRDYVKNKSEEKCDACFAIYSTEYEQDYVYVSQHASLVQEQNIDS